MKFQIPPMKRVKKYWAALLAGLVLGAGGCHYTATNIVREHFCLAPSLYHHCPKCGKFTAKGLPHCCESNCVPAYSGFQATCWRAWPSDWERCPAPNAGACEGLPTVAPLEAQPSMPPTAPMNVQQPMNLPSPVVPSPVVPMADPVVPVPEVKAPELNTPEVKSPVEEKPSVLEKKLPKEEETAPPPPTINFTPAVPAVPRATLVPPPSFDQPTFVEPTYEPKATFTPSPTFTPAAENEYQPELNQPSPSDFDPSPYETTHKPVPAPKHLIDEPTPAAPIADSNKRKVEYQAKREPKKSVLVPPAKKPQPSLTPTSIEPAAPPAIRKNMELPTATKKPEAKVTLPTAVLPTTAPNKTNASLPNATAQPPTFKTSVLNAAKVTEAPRSATAVLEEPELKPIKPQTKSTTSAVSTENLAPIVSPAKTSRANKIPALEAKLSTLTTTPATANRPKLASVQIECAEALKTE